ncbi:MAG: hypothetical protein WBX38_09520 [Candidatus Sulfotelmatobacter sp.]
MFDTKLGHFLTYHHVAQKFFRDHRDKFDGLVIPLSVATVFQQGTGGFVLTLKKPYAVDPRTPIFQADFKREKIRNALLEMAKAHGPSVESIFKKRPLAPADFTEATIQEVAGHVLQFQKDFAKNSSEKVDKYAELLGEASANVYAGPNFLIPPYFRSKSRKDPWYTVSLDLAKAAVKCKENHRLAPVLHFNPDFPEGDFSSILKDYSEKGFDGLIIFFNNLKEYELPAKALSKYADLVCTLREKPLFGLFGGYFTLLLRKIGLPTFSNAVGYGEYRDSGYHSGGQAVRRYYVPALHRYFVDSQAQTLLDIVKEKWLRCTCSVCRKQPTITDLTSQQLLEHFLNARMVEIKEAEQNTLGQLTAMLEATSQKLSGHGLLLILEYTKHLRQWAIALEPFR